MDRWLADDSYLVLGKRNKVKVIDKLLQKFHQTGEEDRLKVLSNLDTTLTAYTGKRDVSKLLR